MDCGPLDHIEHLRRLSRAPFLPLLGTSDEKRLIQHTRSLTYGRIKNGLGDALVVTLATTLRCFQIRVGRVRANHGLKEADSNCQMMLL